MAHEPNHYKELQRCHLKRGVVHLGILWRFVDFETRMRWELLVLVVLADLKLDRFNALQFSSFHFSLDLIQGLFQLFSITFVTSNTWGITKRKTPQNGCKHNWKIKSLRRKSKKKLCTLALLYYFEKIWDTLLIYLKWCFS